MTMALTCALAAIYLPWTHSPLLGTFTGDDAIYVLTAQFFSPYSGPSPIAEYFARHNPYPPLMPLILAIFGGGEDLAVAHAVTTGTLLLAFLLLYLWVRLEGLRPMGSWLVVLIFASAWGTYTQALKIYSESYLIMFAAATLVLTSWAKRQVDPLRQYRYLLPAAVLCGLAILVRSAGIALLIAFIVHVSRLPGRRAATAIVLVLIPSLIAHLFSVRSLEQPSYLQIMSDMLAALQSASAVWDFLSAHLESLATGWMGNFAPLLMLKPFVGAVGLICVAAALHRARQGHLDGLFSLLYLGMLVIWPFDMEPERYLFPLVPFLLGQGFLVLGDLGRHWSLRAGRTGSLVLAYLPAIVLLPINVPEVILTYQRYVAPMPAELEPHRHTVAWYTPPEPFAVEAIAYEDALVRAMRQVADHVPEDECVFSIKPAVLSLYAKRMSRALPRADTADAEFRRQMQAQGCSHILLLPIRSISYPDYFYPFDRLVNPAPQVEFSVTPRGSGDRVAALVRWSAE